MNVVSGLQFILHKHLIRTIGSKIKPIKVADPSRPVLKIDSKY